MSNLSEINSVKPHQYQLSRIDRSVAENLRDIEKSFGEDAGITTDFMVFITQRLKMDFWGYARFTLNDFCRASGRNKQDLCAVHPEFVRNPKKPAPEFYGHKFNTVFDYALYNMLRNNILFSKNYTYDSNNQQITLSKFSILKDIKLNVDRLSNAVKIYEIRLSDDLMDGFLKRYYTIESRGYAQVGKGRGGDGRKLLFIFLYKTMHILFSNKQNITSFPVDFLADIAGRDVKENRNRKTSLKRSLDILREKGNMPFTYKFVQGPSAHRYSESYFVEINFSSGNEISELKETRGDNYFYTFLFEALNKLFTSKYGDIVIQDEEDAFQRWLNNSKADFDQKVNIYDQAYYRAYNKKSQPGQAANAIRAGITKD